MCGGSRSSPAPKPPKLPPPRAMEQVPQRGMVERTARRQVTARMGTSGGGGTAAPTMVLGAPAAQANRRGVQGTGRGTSANASGAINTVLGG